MKRGLVLLLLALNVAAAPCLAEETDSKVKAEVKAVVEKYLKALEGKDLATIMEVHATGPHTIVMGTGPGERWMGKEEIENAHKRFFENFDKEEINCSWESISSKGDMAWIMAMCRITDYLKNEKNEYPINWSAVLEKQEGKWLFVNSHFSNPITRPVTQ
jgi:uncharacterized protein (TIGR02246 family)